MTAYFGLLDICQPKKGETVMINACAGPVGILVGQIAKALGCKVIGCCGSEEKVDYAKKVGFDEVFNYKKKKPWPLTLKKVAPNGIDCFFDNTGGQLSSDIIAHMNDGGRIACCGVTANKNGFKADAIQPAVVLKQLKMEGFLLSSNRYKHRFPSALSQLAEWMKENKLSYHTNIVDGFLNIPEAFVKSVKNQSIGKTIVRLGLPMSALCPKES